MDDRRTLLCGLLEAALRRNHHGNLLRLMSGMQTLGWDHDVTMDECDRFLMELLPLGLIAERWADKPNHVITPTSSNVLNLNPAENVKASAFGFGEGGKP